MFLLIDKKKTPLKKPYKLTHPLKESVEIND